MNTDKSVASFWHTYTSAAQATKLLTGGGEPLAPGSMADAVQAEECSDAPVLEVLEYHQ